MVPRVFLLLLCARLSLQILPGHLSGGGQCIDDDWGCTWVKSVLRFACPVDGANRGLFQCFGPMPRGATKGRSSLYLGRAIDWKVHSSITPDIYTTVIQIIFENALSSTVKHCTENDS
jgi:hypothetical protein